VLSALWWCVPSLQLVNERDGVDSTMTETELEITLGVDTHKDTHVAAAFDPLGRLFGTAAFTANDRGYDELFEWANDFGVVVRAGVEGTGSWGAGLARSLAELGVEVIEVNRPNRQQRRRHGKSDPADAIAAGRAVLAGDATAIAKAGTGPVESLRILRVARRSADRARTQAANQIRSIIDTAPDELRRELRDLKLHDIVERAARWRPHGTPTDPQLAAKVALRSLARRFHTLDAERRDLDEQIAAVVDHAAPTELLEQHGVGPLTAAALLITTGDNPERLRSEASFAALCGSSPIDASSGRQQRHRLNRGGDRQANNALWRIVMVRLRHDPATRAYLQRRVHDGKTKREAIRCLKRYVARDIARILQRHQHTIDTQ
jgi:transposase